MNKNRQIISELKDYFKHNDSSKAVNAPPSRPGMPGWMSSSSSTTRAFDRLDLAAAAA